MKSNTTSTPTLPQESFGALQQLGARIRAQRLARNMTIEQAAERLLCSPSTYRALEQGKPSVSLGLLLHTLWLFDQLGGIEQVCPLDLGMLGNQRARRANLATPGVRDDERNF